ncbi:hypothetical protein ACQJBY_009060 [Aegilops geniculata]
MVDLKRNEHIGERSVFPYLTALVNCALWLCYGITPMGSSLIIVINVLGAALEIYYIYTFLYFCEEDKRLWGFIYVALGFFAWFGILMLFVADMAKYKLFFSWACALCGSLVSISPLFNLGTVRQQKSMDSMPPLLQVALSLANTMLWAGYAYTAEKCDNFIFYPSLVGFSCAVIQLVLHIALRQHGDSGLDESLV